jgi:hypothetical protein
MTAFIPQSIQRHEPLFGFGVKQPKGHSEMELHVEPGCFRRRTAFCGARALIGDYSNSSIVGGLRGLKYSNARLLGGLAH